MEQKIKIENIIDTIEKSIKGEIPSYSIEELIKLEFFDEQKIVNEAIHCLIHFITDEDIREKDTEYDEYMKARLIQYVAEIKSILQ